MESNKTLTAHVKRFPPPSINEIPHISVHTKNISASKLVSTQNLKTDLSLNDCRCGIGGSKQLAEIYIKG